MGNYSDWPLAVPVISAIIERENNGEKEILIQTRIVGYDKLYSGCIEIVAGKVDRFENVYESVKREVKEETGLEVLTINPDVKSKIYKTPKDDAAFIFQPLVCQQLLKGNLPWIGFVFICKVKDGKLRPSKGETKDLRWIKIKDLKEILAKTPDQIFTLQLPVLDYYINNPR